MYEAHLGLARVLYEWNDLAAAEQHGRQSLQLARRYDERVIDRFVVCEIFLARLKLAQGDDAAAAAILAQTAQTVHRRNFVHRVSEVAAAQALVFLRQGKLAEAADLAQAHHLPLIQARLELAQDKPAAALATLATWRQTVEARDWQDERLKTLALQAVAYQANREMGRALQALGEALSLAEPGGFIRLFVDEGPPMARLLSRVAERQAASGYAARLLMAFGAERRPVSISQFVAPADRPLIEPLSPRELEVLRLIAYGLSNQEISERLFLALSTVKGHNRLIFDKLQVQRRTEAVARARELGLL